MACCSLQQPTSWVLMKFGLGAVGRVRAPELVIFDLARDTQAKQPRWRRLGALLPVYLERPVSRRTDRMDGSAARKPNPSKGVSLVLFAEIFPQLSMTKPKPQPWASHSRAWRCASATSAEAISSDSSLR